MKSLYFTLFVLLILSQSSSVLAQRLVVDAFQVKQSPIFEEIKAAKSANPTQSVEDLVKIANESLQTNGLNYVFGFDAATCQRIEQVRANQKDKSAPLNLRGTLSSVDGDKTPLILPEASFDKQQCLPCFMRIPLLEVTQNDFVTSVMKRNIKFHFPPNFVVHEMQSVDTKDLNTVVKRWKIPFLTTPLSISDDGNIIYLGLPEAELNDLVLLIFGEGTMMFGAKKDLNPDKKAKVLTDIPQIANTSNLRFINFSTETANHTLKFMAPCED